MVDYEVKPLVFHPQLLNLHLVCRNCDVPHLDVSPGLDACMLPQLGRLQGLCVYGVCPLVVGDLFVKERDQLIDLAIKAPKEALVCGIFHDRSRRIIRETVWKEAKTEQRQI
jgi:hypothetical protein